MRVDEIKGGEHGRKGSFFHGCSNRERIRGACMFSPFSSGMVDATKQGGETEIKREEERGSTKGEQGSDGCSEQRRSCSLMAAAIDLSRCHCNKRKKRKEGKRKGKEKELKRIEGVYHLRWLVIGENGEENKIS